ncbi:hypothetical protein RDJLphi1_gp34 [Roseobacter phage RDJL Phi 1]|uniref:DUF2815 family protein n=1 Tax=Roseobacter phage RDJL Phi 1 TaxID=562742 RepID=F4YXP5_9CAUD|nr:hypothetical protein RDJLphi1_gp34 [Roseobacter phage RDJL Phi 1]ADK73435.1 hypothetical protein RDJLphi1_gp34 [Roseobacter phage RDJL Phi 1]
MAELVKYLTPVFRGAFTKTVFTPEYFDDDKTGEPKYGITAIWDPEKFSKADQKRWDAIMEALDDESKARFKKSWDKLPANYKKGIRDGEEKADKEGFEPGLQFASLTTKMRPGVVDKERKAIAKNDEEREKWEEQDKDVSNEVGMDAVYSGAYYRATVVTYSYDNKGKGVALGLMNLQKVRDGERIDGRTDASADFEDELDDAWLEEDEDPLD